MNKCSKRVIIHEGLDLAGAIGAALSFDKEYVQGQDIKTGVYHSRTYKTPADQEFQVYHTKSSIVVSEASPVRDAPRVETGVMGVDAGAAGGADADGGADAAGGADENKTLLQDIDRALSSPVSL